MGYDVDRFVTSPNDGLLCCVCRDVLEDPVQGPCEHAYCTACIHGWLVQRNVCPEDRQSLHVSLLRPLFRYMKNDLDSLQIRCRNVEAGCTTVCRLECIASHEETCEYDTVECPTAGCTAMLERRDLEAHLSVCEYRRKLCPNGCGMPILNQDDMEHSCIVELRNGIELLRSEMICKMEEQQHENELRIDAMRQHMITRENRYTSETQELKSQVEDLKRSVEALKESERAKRDEVKRLREDRKEILDMLRTFLRRHVIKDGEGSKVSQI